MKMKKVLAACLAVLMLLCARPVTANTIGEGFVPVASAAFGLPSMKESSITVMPGQKSAQTLLSAEGKKISNGKITWSSSNKSVAKVSSKGTVTGVKSGMAVISAKYNGRTYRCVVSCKNPKIKYSSKTIAVGEKFLQKLTAPSGKEISGSDITWESENKKTATVSSKGTVTGKKAGTVKITATYLGKVYSFTVTVTKPEAPPPTSLEDIVKLNNKALENTLKQKNFTLTNKQPESIDIAIDLSGTGEMLQLETNSKVTTTRYTFANGKTKNGETVAEIYDEKPLKSSYVASATAKKSGSNTVVTIYLKPETATWSAGKVTHAKGNEALFEANLNDFESMSMSEKVSFTYTGTKVEKTINKDGLIIKETIKAPVEGTITVAMPGDKKGTPHAVAFEIKSEDTFAYR